MAVSIPNGDDGSMSSIYGMIRAQRLARKFKARAIFLAAEKRRQENTGRVFIDHTDTPRPVEENYRPCTMQINLPIPRYLATNSKTTYASTPSRLTSATQRPEPKVNTELYKMEPKKRFYEPDVRNIIRDVLEKHLNGKCYNADDSKRSAKELCDLIKEKVKALNFPRYKIICFVYIGQLGDHGVRIASMSLIDGNFDNFAEHYYEGTDFFAVGVVYGFYME